VTYSVLIIDDEPLARRGIRARLKGLNDFSVIADCEDGLSGARAIRHHRPDLVFLDIEMPGLNGFEMLSHLPEQDRPLVIFLTAYDQYALPAFEVHAFDYLLKPIDSERFADAIERVRGQLKLNAAGIFGEQFKRLYSEPSGRDRQYVRRFMVRTGSRVTFVLADEIDWIEAVGDYASLHVGNKASLVRRTLNSLEESLDPEYFLRIHRSIIVRVSKIAELRTLPNRELRVKLADGTDLKVSRTYRNRLDRWLSQR